VQIKILHACTLLFVACAGASAQVQHEPISLQHPRAEAAIRSLTNEFVEGYNSGDVDKMMKLHGPTYIDVNLGSPQQSRIERRRYYAGILAKQNSEIRVTPEKIEVQGNQALVWGTLVIIRKGDSAPSRPIELRYMEAWRKLPEGWRAIWGMDGEINR